MDDHFIYVQGYPDPIQISDDEYRRIRDSMTGEKLWEYQAINTPEKQLMVRIDAISVLESRTKN